MNGPLLVLTPVGNGNNGDQAMLDSLLANTRGEVILILAGAGSLSVGKEFGDRVTALALPSLLAGPPKLRRHDLAKFEGLLARARRFAVMGADSIDGGSIRTSLTRFGLLSMASRRGIPTAVLGFSWREDPPRSVARAMKALDGSVLFLLRDPVSYDRVGRLGISSRDLVADMAFNLEGAPAVSNSELAAWLDRGQAFAVVNVSGLVGRKLDQRRDIVQIVDHIHSQGLRILFLPHVIRDTDNDLEEIWRVARDARRVGDFVVDSMLTPAEVRFVASQAIFSITGRMHLAILSLSGGTPAIPMSTAGKVAGLADMFGLGALVLEPIAGFSRPAIKAIDAVCIRSDELRVQIGHALPKVRDRAAKNWEFTNS